VEITGQRKVDKAHTVWSEKKGGWGESLSCSALSTTGQEGRQRRLFKGEPGRVKGDRLKLAKKKKKKKVGVSTGCQQVLIKLVGSTNKRRGNL